MQTCYRSRFVELIWQCSRQNVKQYYLEVIGGLAGDATKQKQYKIWYETQQFRSTRSQNSSVILRQNSFIVAHTLIKCHHEFDKIQYEIFSVEKKKTFLRLWRPKKLVPTWTCHHFRASPQSFFFLCLTTHLLLHQTRPSHKAYGPPEPIFIRSEHWVSFKVV